MRPDDKLVLKRLYAQPKKLTLNAFVAQAVTAAPKLKLREAEAYFKLRKQKDRIAKDSDPKRQKTRKDKQSAKSRIGGLSMRADTWTCPEKKLPLGRHCQISHELAT